MSNGLSVFVGITFLGLLMIMVLQYSQTTIASTDVGVNLSGTAYNDTYAAETHSVRATLSFMGLLPYLVGVAALVAVLFLLIPSKENIGL